MEYSVIIIVLSLCQYWLLSCSVRTRAPYMLACALLLRTICVVFEETVLSTLVHRCCPRDASDVIIAVCLGRRSGIRAACFAALLGDETKRISLNVDRLDVVVPDDEVLYWVATTRVRQREMDDV